jgi:hypothetical protein
MCMNEERHSDPRPTAPGVVDGLTRVIDEVLGTHMAPVTGFEREVAMRVWGGARLSRGLHDPECR